MHAEQGLVLEESEGSEVARSQLRGSLQELRRVRISAVFSSVTTAERVRAFCAAKAASKSTRLFSLNSLRWARTCDMKTMSNVRSRAMTRCMASANRRPHLSALLMRSRPSASCRSSLQSVAMWMDLDESSRARMSACSRDSTSASMLLFSGAGAQCAENMRVRAVRWSWQR